MTSSPAPTSSASRWRVLLFFLVLFGSAAPLRAQVSGVRFEITAVGDTTLAFSVGRARWVRPGILGLAIDPTKHDVLIAQFRIVRVQHGVATGVVIGQTTQVTRDHVVLLDEPRAPFFRKVVFWGGMLVGFALGVIGSKM